MTKRLTLTFSYDFYVRCLSDKSSWDQYDRQGNEASVTFSPSFPILHISFPFHLTLPHSSLISSPFSHLPSSGQGGSELSASVSGSALCHPPPPCLSLSVPPLSVLPIYLCPNLQDNQTHTRGNKKKKKEQEKANLSDKEKGTVECQGWKHPRTFLHMYSLSSFSFHTNWMYFWQLLCI